MWRQHVLLHTGHNYKNGSEAIEGNYVGGVNGAQTQNVTGVVDM